MVTWLDDQFEPGKASFRGERLLVMRRTDRDRPRALVVLVHGLAGSGHKTWRSLPRQLLTSTVAHVDVAVLDYPSGWRQLRNKPALEEVIELLRAELQSLDYESVVLVGHSMGGIVAAATVRRWGQEFNPAIPVDRIAGLFYVASPRAGTRMPVPTRERRILGIHKTIQSDNELFFSSHVDTSLGRTNSQSLKIPCFAARADADKLVDSFSASIGLPDAQRRPFPGNHSTVLAASSFTDWLEAGIADVLKAHRTPGPTSTRNELTTQFRGDPRYGPWEDAYYRVLDRHLDSNPIPVRNVPDATQGVTLRMRVVAADTITSVGNDNVTQDTVDHQSNRIRALGVATFGTDADIDAHQIVIDAVGGADRRWVSRVSDTTQLEREMTQWLNRVVKGTALEAKFDPSTRRDLSENTELL